MKVTKVFTKSYESLQIMLEIISSNALLNPLMTLTDIHDGAFLEISQRLLT